MSQKCHGNTFLSHFLRFTDGPHRVRWPELGAETDVGVETRVLAAADIAGFVEDVDVIGVESCCEADRRHTSRPKSQT